MEEQGGALHGLRVVDLSDERGLLCGQLLGDLGADVVLVEPPEGSGARKRGPFVTNERNPEDSLLWLAYARNRRGIVVDGSSDAGQRTLRELARSADFWIDSTSPGESSPLRLEPEELLRINPALVVVSITPFGSTGPKASWPACDVTIQAASGPLVRQGDRDRPPVRVSWPQADLHAASDATVGALIAHFERVRSGRGQHVDISAQQSTAAATLAGILAGALGMKTGSRVAGGMRMGPVGIRYVYPAKDGHVSITHTFGPAMGPATGRLMEWLCEEGLCSEEDRDTNWVRYGAALFKGEVTPEEFDRVKEVVAAGTTRYTKDELLSTALERKLLLAPSANARDLVESEQFAARDFIRSCEHSRTGRTIAIPGPFARLSGTPIQYRRAAPTLGQHTDEVLVELKARIEEREGAAAAAATGGDTADLPLADLKVLDLTWAIAGPSVGRIFADYGATVVRLESQAKPDASRTAGPTLPGKSGGREASVLFHTMNTGKVMLGLDLSNEASRSVMLDLVRWADVVTESFSPGVIDRLGYGYETLRKENPGIVMLSTCLMGQTGPLASFAGYGNLGAALSGLLDLTGWPDRAPAGPFSAYTDCIAPRFAVTAVLAALEHRRRTGEGQYIDLSQIEGATHFIAPLIAEASLVDSDSGAESVATGLRNVPTRLGNADRDRAPHGVYPTAGKDEWIAIGVDDDEQWEALVDVLGIAGQADLAHFATAVQRRAAGEALDRLVAEHTSGWEGAELDTKLVARGVAAHHVQDGQELAADPQLVHRGHFVEISHPTADRSFVESSRFVLSRTPARRPTDTPALGADNQRVLEEILGYDEDRITEIVISGALN